MALDPIELYEAGPSSGPNPRVIPRYRPSVTFASAASDMTLAVMTPVGQVTASGRYKEWDPAAVDGSQVISGFVWPTPIDVAAAGERVGTILKRGLIHRDDIVCETTDDAGLNTGLKAASLRQKGIDVEGLPGI